MNIQNSDYQLFLTNLKSRIQSAQMKATLAVNQEMILLYWNIGNDILAKQEELGWGAKVINKLSKDLRSSFPDQKGFSARNLKYMRKFASEYPDLQFVQQLVAQIPWGHNIWIFQKVKSSEQRAWYIEQTIKNGWSRNVLEHQISTQLYERAGSAPTNFQLTLPKPQSDLAHQLIKDPYKFDFLDLSDEASEKDLEKALVDHIQDFLLELGKGFAFVGRQVHLEVGGEDFYIDLLLYHLKLRCYVVIELKTGKFKPEHSGKLNFYLSAVDDLMRHPDDQPSIGMIICKDKNETIAEYAIRDINKPMGVSGYELAKLLPEQLKGQLPTIEELEAELDED